MTKITMADILTFSQEEIKQYYLKISGDEHLMDTLEYWNNIVFPFIIENGVLEDIERKLKGAKNGNDG